MNLINNIKFMLVGEVIKGNSSQVQAALPSHVTVKERAPDKTMVPREKKSRNLDITTYMYNVLLQFNLAYR
jgi:hypothetical protein